jgi:hypothetical protein
VSSA